MIRYTQKTRDILNFIDKYGFITCKICSNIFYKNVKYGLTQSRATLDRIVKNGDIIANKQEYGREKFYQFSKKVVPKHDYYILNLYGEINKLVNTVEEFHLEQHWIGGKRRSDGLIVVGVNIDKEYYSRPFFIECDFTHKTDKDKYNEIYEDGEVQEKYGLFPDVIQLAFTDKPTIESNGEYKVIGLDYNFTNLASKILIG